MDATKLSGYFQVALRRLSAGRTTLIIAHRLSTVVDADQIRSSSTAAWSSMATTASC